MNDPQEDYQPRHRDASWTAEARSLVLDAYAELADELHTPRHRAEYVRGVAK